MTTYRVIDLIGYEADTPESDELMGYGIMAEDGDSMKMLPQVYGTRSEADREIVLMEESDANLVPSYEITYVSDRPKRVVGPEHFERSSAFAPVLRMQVGEKIERRYRSAGYKSIKRVS